MKIFLIAATMLLWPILLLANTLPVKGCIAIFQGPTPISIEVELPPFSGGIFRTDQFHFSNLPQNMIPDNSGRYCYSMQDDRFAYVQAYYYAVKQIQDYNEIFKKLGLPLGKTLDWTVTKETSLPPFGDTSLLQGHITYTNPVIDPNLIQHEIGHWVHQNAKGVDGGGDEGAANLLAVLHSGNPIQGKVDGYYGNLISYDVDTFVQSPNHMLSTMQYYKQVLQDPIFSKKFPAFTNAIQSQLELAEKDPDFAALLNEPNPYTSSSIINQPLWQATMLYGVETIKLLYIKTIATSLNQARPYSFSEIANALIAQASVMKPELSSYLKREYNLRGLLNSRQISPSTIGCHTRFLNFTKK